MRQPPAPGLFPWHGSVHLLLSTEVKLRTAIVLSVLSFCVGGVAEHLRASRTFVQNFDPASLKGVPNIQDRYASSPKLIEPGAGSPNAQKKNESKERADSQQIQNEISSTADPKKPGSILSAELEARLEKLIFKPFPALVDSKRIANPDGSVDEVGPSEDGNIVYHHYGPEGRLRNERWTNKATGEYFDRRYYDSGVLKNVFWKRSENDISLADFDESGSFSGRFDHQGDFSYFTAFTDSGDPREIYRKASNGEGETIWTK